MDAAIYSALLLEARHGNGGLFQWQEKNRRSGLIDVFCSEVFVEPIRYLFRVAFEYRFLQFAVFEAANRVKHEVDARNLESIVYENGSRNAFNVSGSDSFNSFFCDFHL